MFEKNINLIDIQTIAVSLIVVIVSFLRLIPHIHNFSPIIALAIFGVFHYKNKSFPDPCSFYTATQQYGTGQTFGNAFHVCRFAYKKRCKERQDVLPAVGYWRENVFPSRFCAFKRRRKGFPLHRCYPRILQVSRQTHGACTMDVQAERHAFGFFGFKIVRFWKK